MGKKHKPGLRVQHHWQRTNYCGPSALKMQLSNLKRQVSEKRIAALAHASSTIGTEHEGLVRAARELGVYVFQKKQATLEDISYFIHKERLPVLVGWFSQSTDHYAVATNIGAKRISVADPEWPTRPRRFLRSHFNNVWFDFRGKKCERVCWRWLMVISNERRRFAVEGGTYHLPVRKK